MPGLRKREQVPAIGFLGRDILGRTKEAYAHGIKYQELHPRCCYFHYDHERISVRLASDEDAGDIGDEWMEGAGREHTCFSLPGWNLKRVGEDNG